MINAAAVLDHHAAIRPDKIALAWRGGEYTYAQLLERVNAVAAALAERGIREGDHVALLMQNTPEFIETVYAANRLGAAFLPLNFRLAPAEWRYILDHGRAAAVVTEALFETDLTSVIEGLPIGVRLTIDRPATGAFDRYDDVVARHQGKFVAPVDVSPETLQRLMYTSGTTARPKGVCITHSNFAWKTLGLLVQFGWNHTDITVVGGPLYHVGALDMGGISTLHVGGSLVLQKKFDADGLLALIEEYRATNCWLAPAMVNSILQSPLLKKHDLSSLRTILSGGEKMPEARLRQLLEVLPDLWFADAYGLTETLSSDTFLDRDHMVSKLGSVGLPLPHQEIRIVDDAGEAVSTGTVGEITVRGPKVFSGYWRDADATAAAIRDGWFHTGDMGRRDEDGYLYVEDRKKDMLISGGENIASPEVERVLYEHPAVLEAAVVGHPDEKWGEVPKAIVVLRTGAEATAGELIDFCRDRLARFKVPRYVEFIDALPRTPSGKVLKRELRLAASGEGASR
ncbi:fatty-acyl-CoA synthase [Mycobacterium mantenii]|uniref:Long-chain-fatty-acid--CoA ligase FadD13 n=1 Tax=Mycobacterium mantenii TaxID=560555 RepID=A0A1X0FMT8_MYCNT|nr:long-chain fatty acid--CoA ligase [Mycobacterium mantenii]MCV7246523.1 long-chain fatty acid--CoA ligase [Mycobacterium mantenii]ORB02839.1 fatty-acyl-CoA synthase [Mycobacterium mantenii]BBY38035.1 fatty-acyl-CoA synthase [Mycobacterium mantenii]